MTQPKFPWALLLIVAMFTFIAITSAPGYMFVFSIIAIITAAAGAVYQSIPRKLDPLVDHRPPGSQRPAEDAADDEPDDFDDPWARDPKA